MFTNNQTTNANVNLQAHTHRRTQIHTSASFSEHMQVHANIHIDNEDNEVQPYIEQSPQPIMPICDELCSIGGRDTIINEKGMAQFGVTVCASAMRKRTSE